MSETLTQTQARITAYITESAPNIDTSPGSVFNELIIKQESTIQNYVKNDVATLAMGQAISLALNSTVDTYDPIIDQIASNYNVTRNQGQTATGTIRVTVSSTAVGTIAQGTAFVQPTLNFVYGVASDISPSLGTTLLSNGQNLYYFDVPVQALAAGVDKIVNDGTQFELQISSSIPYFVNAVAVGSFSAGQNTETDKQLISRFRAGMSVKNMTSVDSITSQLHSTYPGFQSVYLADHNDPLNLRAANNPLQLKLPGCVDVYLRNSVSLESRSFVVQGVEGSGVYTLNIVPDTSNMAFGFYKITSIQVQDPNVVTTGVVNATFSTVYGVISSTTNNVQTSAEARFSVYQKATVTVTYTKASGVSTVPPSFVVTCLVPSNLYEVQNMFSDPATRLPNADYLVKGVVPCVVSVTLSVVPTNKATFDSTQLKADIFNYINSLPVGQPVLVSKIINLCHKYPIDQVRLPIILTGSVMLPAKTNNTGDVVDNVVKLSGTDSLSIPDLTQYGANSNNTAFFTNYFTTDNAENINVLTE